MLKEKSILHESGTTTELGVAKSDQQALVVCVVSVTPSHYTVPPPAPSPPAPTLPSTPPLLFSDTNVFYTSVGGDYFSSFVS